MAPMTSRNFSTNLSHSSWVTAHCWKSHRILDCKYPYLKDKENIFKSIAKSILIQNSIAFFFFHFEKDKHGIHFSGWKKMLFFKVNHKWRVKTAMLKYANPTSTESPNLGGRISFLTVPVF